MKCPKCGCEMEEKDEMVLGEIVFDRLLPTRVLYQCPKCKNIEIKYNEPIGGHL